MSHPSREVLAKWLFDYDYGIDYPEIMAKRGSQWPESSRIQPYCRKYYKFADALLEFLKSKETQ